MEVGVSRLVYIIISLLIISAIVVAHEFGHFIFAKINGIKVNEFAVGMGPVLLSREYKGTRFSIKLFPIGGSCMMQGEDTTENDEGSFNSKNVWQRISVVLAGPMFNFILAFILALVIVGFMGYDPARVEENGLKNTVDEVLKEGDIITSINGSKISVGRDIYNYFYFNELTEEPLDINVIRDGDEISLSVPTVKNTKYYMGIQYSSTDAAAEITVTDDYPAAKAGIRSGDIIIGINGYEIESGEELEKYFNKNPLSESPITIKYLHNSKTSETTLTPIWSTQYSVDFYYNIGREKCSSLEVIKYSFTEVNYWIKTTIKSLMYMLGGHVNSDSVGGVVRVVDEVSESVEESREVSNSLAAFNLIYWAIVISANLGVMNLLPIPALDGGRLVFMIIEVFRGKPIDKEKEAMVHLIGIILLMILMIFLFYNDIRNIFF